MKANVEIVLDGGMRLPATCKLDSLKDVAALGQKITATARNAKRLLPDLAALPVRSIKITLEGK